MTPRLLSLAVVICSATLIAGCAPRTVEIPPVPVAPRHVDFVYPTVPEGTDAIQTTRIERGWRFLQADDLRNAQREFEGAIKLQPSFHPAQAGLGYVELAERDWKSAITWFDRALGSAADYVPALIGRGHALLEVNRDSDALASFEAALKADPSRIELQPRIEVLRFRAVQDDLTRAKAASDAGKWAAARDAYNRAIASSPESAFLYRELAFVERKAGDLTLALEHFKKALMLEPNDARSHAQIGAILEEQGDVVGALAAYESARAIDRSEVSDEIVARVRDAAALAKLPAEYRAIPSAEGVTRGEVAALIGVRLQALLARTPQRQVVVTDVRGHWAQAWILPVVRAGVMETQPNYTFQPALRVRRGDLAQIVSRALAVIAAQKPAAARVWQGARPKISDVPPGHLSYPAVSQAIASGVMPLLSDGAFQLLRPVTGAEALEVITRLEALAKP